MIFDDVVKHRNANTSNYASATFEINLELSFVVTAAPLAAIGDNVAQAGSHTVRMV